MLFLPPPPGALPRPAITPLGRRCRRAGPEIPQVPSSWALAPGWAQGREGHGRALVLSRRLLLLPVQERACILPILRVRHPAQSPHFVAAGRRWWAER